MQMRALTQLCLFAEAVRESGELLRGTGILLPRGQYVATGSPQVCRYCPHIVLLYTMPMLHFPVDRGRLTFLFVFLLCSQ